MTSNLRIGQGYDLHQTEKDLPLMLGGVEITSDFGLKGHSDADVLLHAITDAMLGAAALGDIGRMFPDTDPKYEKADSRIFLTEVLDLIRHRGFQLINVDCTIIAEKPKLERYMDQINQSLSNLLSLPIDCVNVKAKTNEKLGYLGKSKGIAAQAVVLLEKI